jgi:putative acetyltransferase
MSLELIVISQPGQYDTARLMFREYADSITTDLCFQSFQEELQQIETQYGLPTGGIILLKFNDEWIGCAGIRRINEHTAELKRMYIRPPYQGKGLGHELLNASLQLAKSLHYSKLRLDTLETMKVAQHLYKHAGFEETEPYYRNPNDGVLFMEKAL